MASFASRLSLAIEPDHAPLAPRYVRRMDKTFAHLSWLMEYPDRAMRAHDRFTQACDTADLREAKALVAALT